MRSSGACVSESRLFVSSLLASRGSGTGRMCVAFLFLKARGDASRAPAVVLCVNRDEAFGRPTLPSHWWEDAPEVFAGRDLEAGGTWCGVSRTGRVAVLTNFSEPAEVSESLKAQAPRPSRGALAADFLKGVTNREEANEVRRAEQHEHLRTPSAYAAHVSQTRDKYAGFNLIVGDCHTGDFYYVGNRGDAASEGSPVRLDEERMSTSTQCTENVYGETRGLSNATLKTKWPKVVAGAKRLSDAVKAYARGSNPEAPEEGDACVPENSEDNTSLLNFAETLLHTVLQNDGTWRPARVDEKCELATSASAFVAPGAAPKRAGAYGTRCSTVIAVRFDMKAAVVVERTLAWSNKGGGSESLGNGAWSAPRRTTFATSR